tara:strand:+ start:2751 stop:4004 length:1254 start_codon:yes stop_codon:yes gene_type:complete
MQEGLLGDTKGEKIPSLLPKNDDLEHVINVLCAGGYGAWVVGGAVRDCILGKIPEEYDICTTANPDEIIEAFEETIPTGKKYGTVTVKSGNSMFEVTTLRTETGYGDGRRPDIVEWGTSLKVDLSRRDFTMNAMAYDLVRELLHDPFNGKSDLTKGLLKAVGNASQRLSEDGLRIMRAYRFMDRQESGLWLPDFSLSAALIDNRAMLAMVSIERIWNELSRIIIGKNAGQVLARMNQDGVLSAIIGYPISQDVFPLIAKLRPDLEGRIALMFSELKLEEITVILERLKVPKLVFERTKRLHFLIENNPTNTELRLYRNSLGEEVVTHMEILSALGKDITLMAKSLQYPYGISCLIDGDWIMKRTGLSPGVRLGRLKDWLFRLQIERNYQCIDQMETALCTIPWQNGNPDEWPKSKWA